MGRYRVYIYANNKINNGYVLPFVEAGGMTTNRDQETTDWETARLYYSLTGKEKPLEISIQGTYPCRKYSFAAPKSRFNSEKFRSWLEKHRKARHLFRVIITDGGGRTVSNMLSDCTAFSFTPQKNGNWRFSLTFKQHNRFEGEVYRGS